MYSNYYLSQRLSNLQYEVDEIVNPITGYVPIQGNTNIQGIKTFINAPPQCPIGPTLADDLVNKTYVDSLVPTPLEAVLINGNQTLGSGVKTFINLPQSTTVPLNDKDFVNKLYVDSHGTGITINDVLTNTLPFTATQTFNNTIIANSLITGNITNSNNSLNVNITDTPTGGPYIIPFVSSNSGNVGLKCDSGTLKYNAATKTLICTNFNGLSNLTSNVMLTNETANTGTFPIVVSNVVSGSAVQGASSTLTYTPSPNGLLQTGSIKTPTINIQTITSDTSSLLINPLTNFSQCPTTSINATTSNQLTNYQTVQALVAGGGIGAALLASPNIFTAQNTFNNFCPTTNINATTTDQLANYQTVQSLISAGVSGVALLASPNIFTAQNTFNNFCPQTQIAPSINNSLINLLYLNTQLNGLQYTYSKKANFYNSINDPTRNFFINISNPAPGGISDWGYNDFFTIRYKISTTYPNVPIPNACPNASIYSGYIDIYPVRIPNTLIIGTSQINIINNSINGNNAYYIGTSQPTWAPNGRQMWAYNTYNQGVNPPPLYLMAVDNNIIPTISMKFILNNPNSAGANPPDTIPNIYYLDFTLELITWGGSTPQKITTTGFTTNF